MGLNEGGGHKTYLTISEGRIAKRVSEDEPRAIRCTNKEGSRTWFERRYPSITGMITDVRIKNTQWGDDLCVTIEDGESFELQMKLDSKYAKGFLLCMPSIDLSRPVTFTPWMKEVSQDGKMIKKTNLYLSHGPNDEDRIEWYWTREEPKGLPDLNMVKLKGKDVFDDTERMDFLKAHLEHTFKKRIIEATGGPKAIQPAARVVDEEEDPLF